LGGHITAKEEQCRHLPAGGVYLPLSVAGRRVLTGRADVLAFIDIGLRRDDRGADALVETAR
jgi:hypothetical protein